MILIRVLTESNQTRVLIFTTAYFFIKIYMIYGVGLFLHIQHFIMLK